MNRSMAIKHHKAKKEAIKAALENENIFAGTTFFASTRKSAYSADFWRLGKTMRKS